MRLSKLIPQPLAVLVCAMRGHPQKRYSAWHEGIQVVVYTCRCGKNQEGTKLLPANRDIRRKAAKVRKRRQRR